MILEHPERLWALLILPVLYWLARPPRPRRVVATAHLAAWDAALRRLGRRDARFRRLRFWLLALAAAAAALASTAPRLADRPGPERYVLIVDRSASTAATEVDGGSAAVRIRARLEAWLASLSATTDLRLIDTHAATVVDGGMPRAALRVRRGTPAEIAALLAAPAPEGAPRAFASALDLDSVAAELAADPGAFVWLCTDGRGAVPSIEPVGWRREVFGTTRPNRGFVAAAVEDRWPLPEVVVELAVRGDDGFAVDGFTVGGGARLETAERLDGAGLGSAGRDDAGAGGTSRAGAAAPSGAGQPLDDPGAPTAGRRDPVAGGGFGDTAAIQRFRLRLSRDGGGAVAIGFAAAIAPPGGDALASDDELRLELPPPPAPDVAVLAADGGAAAALLRHAAGRLADLAGGAVVAAEPGRPVSFLLVGGGRLEAVPGPCLTLGTAIGAAPAADLEVAPRVVDWDRIHPLTAGLDLSELVVRSARVPETLPTGVVLIRGTDGPLAVARDAAGERSVHLAFGIDEANLAGLPAWPQLLLRAWVWSAVGTAAARLAPDQPLDPAESDLTVRAATAGPEVPLPARRGARLVPWLLGLALVALALRVFA